MWWEQESYHPCLFKEVGKHEKSQILMIENNGKEGGEIG